MTNVILYSKKPKRYPTTVPKKKTKKYNLRCFGFGSSRFLNKQVLIIFVRDICFFFTLESIVDRTTTTKQTYFFDTIFMRFYMFYLGGKRVSRHFRTFRSSFLQKCTLLFRRRKNKGIPPKLRNLSVFAAKCVPNQNRCK